MKIKVYRLFIIFLISLPFTGFSVVNVGSRGIRFDWLIAAIMILLFVLDFLASQRKIKVDTIVFFAGVFVVGLLLSAYVPLRSGEPEKLIDFTTTFILFLLGASLFVACYNTHLTKKNINAVIKALIIVSFVVACLGILQFIGSYFGMDFKLSYTSIARPQSHSGYEALTGVFKRSTGPFSEPRRFGAFLLTPIILSLIIQNSKLRLFRRRLTMQVVSLVLIMGLLCSLSTSAIYSMMFSLVLFFFCLATRRPRFIVFLCALLPFTLLLYFAAMSSGFTVPPIARRLVLPSFSSLYEQFTTMNRPRHGWFRYVGDVRVAIEIWYDFWLFGIGLNNMRYYPEYDIKGVHGLFNLLVQTGVVGLSAFLIFLGVLLKKLLNQYRRTTNHTKGYIRLAFALIVVSLIASFASGIYGYSTTFLWANFSLAGLICSNINNLEPAKELLQTSKTF